MPNHELNREDRVPTNSQELKPKGLEGIDMVKNLKHFLEPWIGRGPTPRPEGLDYDVYQTTSMLLSVVERILEDPVKVKNDPYDHNSIKHLLRFALRNINFDVLTDEECKKYEILENKSKRKLKLRF